MSHRVGPIAVIVATAMAPALASVPTSQTALPSSVLQTSPVGLVDRFLAPDRQPLVSYRAIRHLSASARGGRVEASIDAVTSFDPTEGFTYQVTAEEGSGTIRHKVLIAALAAEQKAVDGRNAAHVALTRDNYEFLGVTDGLDNLLKVDIRPRRKHAMLIAGSVFLAGDTAELVRIEGEPTERPSFWTRHVRIVREYARVGGVRVPVAMRSTADVLVVGASNFTMTYQYTQINGVPVSDALR